MELFSLPILTTTILKYIYIYIYMFFYLFMKTNKMFTIDIELAERLKAEPNQSLLINDLIANHYKVSGLKSLTLDEKKELHKKLKLKKELENQIKELNLSI